MILLLLAKALSVSGFCGMYVFTGELFPTLCRGTTFGYCGIWSRMGSLIAPQLVAWMEVVGASVPMISLGALLGVSGVLMLLLPETLDIQMPNTMQDVEELWGRGGGKLKEER